MERPASLNAPVNSQLPIPNSQNRLLEVGSWRLGVNSYRVTRRSVRTRRTARINTMRGIVARARRTRSASGLAQHSTRIPTIARRRRRCRCPIWCGTRCGSMLEEVRAIEARVATIDQQLARVARDAPHCPPSAASAQVWVCSPPRRSSGPSSHIHAFRRGRRFCELARVDPAGIVHGQPPVPRRRSVNEAMCYLRCLLTHGARAVLLTAQRTARDDTAAADAACNSGP